MGKTYVRFYRTVVSSGISGGGDVVGRLCEREKKGEGLYMSPEFLLGARKWLSSSMASCLWQKESARASDTLF